MSATSILSSVTMVLNHPYLRLLALAAFVLGGAQMCASTFLISYFYKGLDYTALAAGAMLTIANVAGVIFRLVWGAAADRGVNPRQLLAGLAVLTSVSVAAMASQTLMTQHMAAAIVCFVLGSTAIGWNGVLLAEVAEAAPASAVSTATAGCMFFSFGGVMTFPVLFGFIQRATGSYFSSWMATAGAAALLGITLLSIEMQG
jgi:sugar phosphate permease